MNLQKAENIVDKIFLWMFVACGYLMGILLLLGVISLLINENELAKHLLAGCVASSIGVFTGMIYAAIKH